MTPGRRLLATLVTLGGVVAGSIVVPGSPAAAADPIGWTARHSAAGFVGLLSTGAGLLKCPDTAPTCTDPLGAPVGTEWVDSDADGDTFSASSARLVLPPKATVEWAGLYWTGDRATTRDGSPPRCDAAPAGSTAAAPPAPDRADRVRVKVGGGRYADVKTVDLRTADGPASTGFQGYADVTSIVKPKQPAGQATQIELTVANVQVAKGINCAAGWQVMIVYKYPDGPDPTFAPAYRSISVFDGITAVSAAAAPGLALDGLRTGAEGAVDARVTAGLLTSGGAVARETFTVNGTGVAGAPLEGWADPPGYTASQLTVPEGVIAPKSSGVAIGFGPARDAYLAGAVAVSTRLPVRVDLAVTTAVTPDSAAVGNEVTVTVTVRNDGGVPATGVAVTARLPAGLTLLATPAGYNGPTGVWSVGTVAAGATKILSLRVRVDAIGSFISAAEVTASDTPDLDSTPGDGPGPQGTPTPQDDYAQVTLTGLPAQPSTTPSATGNAEAVPASGGGLPLNMPPLALFGIGVFALGLMMFMLVVRRGRAA